MRATVIAIGAKVPVRQKPASGAPIIGYFGAADVVDVAEILAGGVLSKPWARLNLRAGGAGMYASPDAGPGAGPDLVAAQSVFVPAAVLAIEQPAPVGVRVPWWTQVENGYTADSGPACWAMLASARGLTGFSLSSLIRCMRVRGQVTDADAAASCLGALGLPLMRGLSASPPYMAHVSYSRLTGTNPAFDGAQWVVVTGQSTDLIAYHDPLWPTATRGAYRTTPLATWREAEIDLSERVGVGA